ncbi:hypothetical protein [Paraburkholderia hospita]|uniref:hypothetical protein n=1 Tax=Paraburkholderia TaxID=1822464 RepID=UPI001F61EB1D|nr:hypothetical protein [Paraburkholderia hospita]
MPRDVEALAQVNLLAAQGRTMTMTRESFEQELITLLRDQPLGTTADLSDFMVAYWSGTSLIYAYLGAGTVEEELEVDDNVWEEWRPNLEEWHASPVFSVRSELAGERPSNLPSYQ